MVTKYLNAGFLVMRGQKVEPQKSLVALEGHLDHTKWLAARASLEKEVQGDTPPEIEPQRFVQDDDTERPPSWRARKDRADAQIRELELAERMGQLVDAGEVRQAVGDAVSTFWSETERRLRQDADHMAGALGLSADQARQLRLSLADRNRALRTTYAEAMQKRAEEIAPHNAKRAE